MTMTFYKLSPKKNQYRWYRAQIVLGLFGDWAVVCEWGRIGQDGKKISLWFSSEDSAKDKYQDIIKKRISRGYSTDVPNVFDK